MMYNVGVIEIIVWSAALVGRSNIHMSPQSRAQLLGLTNFCVRCASFGLNLSLDQGARLY